MKPPQRQFESVLGGYKGSEWCHNEVGGQATTIANYLQSMPSICRVCERMSAYTDKNILDESY